MLGAVEAAGYTFPATLAARLDVSALEVLVDGRFRCRGHGVYDIAYSLVVNTVYLVPRRR